MPSYRAQYQAARALPWRLFTAFSEELCYTSSFKYSQPLRRPHLRKRKVARLGTRSRCWHFASFSREQKRRGVRPFVPEYCRTSVPSGVCLTLVPRRHTHRHFRRLVDSFSFSRTGSNVGNDQAAVRMNATRDGFPKQIALRQGAVCTYTLCMVKRMSSSYGHGPCVTTMVPERSEIPAFRRTDCVSRGG